MVKEVWIIGQGLAGTLLAKELTDAGLSVRIADEETAVTSSKIAGGLVTPISGQRLALGWRVRDFFPAAQTFYRSWEQSLGIHVWHELPIERLFTSEAEAAKWATRSHHPDFLPYIAQDVPSVARPDGPIEAPWGSARFHGAWLDIPSLINAARQHWISLGLWESRRVDPDEARTWTRAKPGRVAIFCEGAAAQLNPLLSWIRWKAAKGDILDLHIDPAIAPPTDRLYSGGVWLQHRGHGHWRTGSTYTWDTRDASPSATSRTEIITRLQRWMKAPFHVIGHQAAIRPIIRESKAICGRLPAAGWESIGVFNGLGSKGALHAPWAAKQWRLHLVDGQPLDREIDLQSM